ncbi:unnamed protein product [Brassica rapa]|uniref:Uncharacterized protein n=1 Tax=Brassica campestris TaxID=3711 RepID=A0A3P5YZK1_BRACM|nr:unnamed protein product [Brassica rapa]VDC73222.1 unnamed protein product [Brassica rapa]
MLHTYMSMEEVIFWFSFFLLLLFCAGTTGSSCFRLLV